MANAINVIYPYLYKGMWVFDDERKKIDHEPFVGGTDIIIDRVLSAKGIENAKEGFRLIFSASQFPGYDLKVVWKREGGGGNFYYSEDYKMEGWLCSVLMMYFDSAPKEIYAKFDELNDHQ